VAVPAELSLPAADLLASKLSGIPEFVWRDWVHENRQQQAQVRFSPLRSLYVFTFGVDPAVFARIPESQS
jgi:hypothetical protein